MASFYGGPAGQSFAIKVIFPSYYGEGGLKEDLAKGWSSPVQVGEYVMISYGDPSDDKMYQSRLDSETDGKNYNSTLWQKAYIKGSLIYEFITSCVGATPKIAISDETEVIGPNETPYVKNIGTVINPIFQFGLPQAASFYYGNLLGKRNQETYTVTDASFSTYKIGDCYVNEGTGFIYKIVDKPNDITCIFHYEACIQGLPPTAEVTSISPYVQGSSGYEPASPQVERVLVNEENAEWKLVFKLPKAPKTAVTSTFVGSTEQGSINSAITSEDTVTFTFKIPAGAKIFNGTEVVVNGTTPIIAGARVGDVYVNTNTGIIYTLTVNGWEAGTGSIKGPSGDALNIKAEYQLTETETYAASIENGAAYIEEHYTGTIDSSMLFVITWTLLNDASNVSYWYFKTDDWGRIQLTGSSYNLILNQYEENSTDKTYSVDYINKLVPKSGNVGEILTKTENGQAWAEAPKSIKNLVDASQATGSIRMVGVQDNQVTGNYAFVEGYGTAVSGYASHAEGEFTTASGQASHTEGSYSTASGAWSHAENSGTVASGPASHAEGLGAVANHRAQHAQGEYNINDSSTAAANERGTYAHIVGNGTATKQSNAHTLDWDGNAWFAGDVYVGSTSGTNKDDGSVKLIKSPGSATDGQVLTYDGDSSEWVAKDAGGGEAEIFIATYNTTTYAEINEAYSAGKILFCKKDNDMAPLVGKASSDSPEAAFYFGAIDGLVSYLYKCVDSGTSTEWSVSEKTLMQSGSTSYITTTTLNSRLNRSTSVAASDTNYTSYMVRGEALNNTAVTPQGYGQISWQYA